MQRGKYYFSVALRITTKALSARCDVDETRAISFPIVPLPIPGERMYFLYFGMIAPSRKCLPIVRAVREVCSRMNKLRREVKEFALLYERVSQFFAREVLHRRRGRRAVFKSRIKLRPAKSFTYKRDMRD